MILFHIAFYGQPYFGKIPEIMYSLLPQNCVSIIISNSKQCIVLWHSQKLCGFSYLDWKLCHVMQNVKVPFHCIDWNAIKRKLAGQKLLSIIFFPLKPRSHEDLWKRLGQACCTYWCVKDQRKWLFLGWSWKSSFCMCCLFKRCWRLLWGPLVQTFYKL